jgi:low affinity Fe/Cu permease
MSEWFRRFSQSVARWAGSAYAFLVALLVIIVWSVTGPLFGFSDTWQLVINTGTTIVTFLMVFIIQNTQNRDSQALHMKLDDLIIHSRSDNHFVEAEELSDEELHELKEKAHRLVHSAEAESSSRTATREKTAARNGHRGSSGGSRRSRSEKASGGAAALPSGKQPKG